MLPLKLMAKFLLTFVFPEEVALEFGLPFVLQAVMMHSKQVGRSVLSCSVIVVRTKQGISRPTFILQKMNSGREKKRDKNKRT